MLLALYPGPGGFCYHFQILFWCVSASLLARILVLPEDYWTLKELLTFALKDIDEGSYKVRVGAMGLLVDKARRNTA